jgi:hypothetical protein
MELSLNTSTSKSPYSAFALSIKAVPAPYPWCSGRGSIAPTGIAKLTAIAGVPDHKINRKQHYLWRAVDQDGEVVDVFLQAKRDGTAAKRFFKRLLRSHGQEPRKVAVN